MRASLSVIWIERGARMLLGAIFIYAAAGKMAVMMLYQGRRSEPVQRPGNVGR
jgi:hypothetical protein